VGFKRRLTGVSVIAAALTVTAGGLTSPAHADATATSEYTVVAADNVSTADAAAAITNLGGTIIRSNEAVGMFTVQAPATGFVEKAAASPADRRHIPPACGRRPTVRAAFPWPSPPPKAPKRADSTP